jgi:hypothetical protein
MRRLGIVSLLGLLCALSGAAGRAQQKGGEPEIRIVKYDGLAQEVLKHRGKVVLVDIWFTL